MDDSVSDSSHMGSRDEIRVNTFTSDNDHHPMLEDYPNEGKSVDNIQKLFELLRVGGNQFEVEGIKYQLDVTKHEIDEMMRAYAEMGQLAYDNSRTGDLTSPSYLKLQ